MKNNNDILQREEFRQNPFTAPEGYFASLEDSLRDKVFATEKKPAGFVGVLKPALMMACSFAVILGIGYGILSMTGGLASQNPRCPNMTRLPPPSRIWIPLCSNIWTSWISKAIRHSSPRLKKRFSNISPLLRQTPPSIIIWHLSNKIISRLK